MVMSPGYIQRHTERHAELGSSDENGILWFGFTSISVIPCPSPMQCFPMFRFISGEVCRFLITP